jgi:quercetin dioxygenase-like cupin family protein
VNVFEFGAEGGFEILGFGSRGAAAVPLTLPDGKAHVVCIRLAAGGLLGRHPASVDQMFVVVDGSGWVRGSEGERTPVDAGTVVYWNAGEEHESGSDLGMTAIVIEAERIRARLA